MYVYRTEPIVIHVGHAWEEWHAYLTADLPDSVDRDASGICCHTCQAIILT